MGKKIFVSYKFADSDVYPLAGQLSSTVRNYVDNIEDYLDSTDDIYKGESNDDDLSSLSDDTIWTQLKDRIFDSSVTIVIISPNMKLQYRTDKSQWIPWEISFSLKETTRDDRTSHSNAVFAIVLPDRNNSYRYYIEDNTCCVSTCRTLRTDTLFSILKKNMFNQKQSNSADCQNGRTVYYGESSYIFSVKWADFIKNAQGQIDRAVNLQNNIDDYDICKEV
jgi:hypothetical protein